MSNNKTIEISDELYQTIQELKWIFSQMTWEKLEKDEDVLWILISWFVDSMNHDNMNDGDDECCEWHWHSHWDDDKCCGSWKHKSDIIV